MTTMQLYNAVCIAILFGLLLIDTAARLLNFIILVFEAPRAVNPLTEHSSHQARKIRALCFLLVFACLTSLYLIASLAATSIIRSVIFTVFTGAMAGGSYYDWHEIFTYFKNKNALAAQAGAGQPQPLTLAAYVEQLTPPPELVLPPPEISAPPAPVTIDKEQP